MKREFSKLADRQFDLLVIGGGIYGAWVAYDASLRGLRVAIVEKKDWAAGTSSASSKLIHGGLRYLERSRFSMVRIALDERERLFRAGRHRVRRLQLVLPLYKDARVGRFRLGMGLRIYDRLAGRHDSFEDHNSLSREELVERYGFLNPAGLKAGFTYSDGLTDDARLTLEVIDGACGAGAIAVNRARAVNLIDNGGVIAGAVVKDMETGEAVAVRAAMTASCAGPWSQELIDAVRPSSSPLLRMSKGVHLVMPALPTDDGFLLISKRHGGVVFMIPWYGRTLLGTTDTEFQGDPDQVAVDDTDRAYLLAQANHVLAGSPWRESDIIGSFAGIRSLPYRPGRSSAELTRELSIEEPLRNLLVSAGGKMTSARADAAMLVDLAIARMDKERVGCATHDLPLPWFPRGSYREWRRDSFVRGLELGLDEMAVNSCQERYGTTIDTFYDTVAEAPALAGRIVPELPFCFGEAIHAVRREMARSLEDILRRRMPLLLLCKPTRETLGRVAGLVGPILGWSGQRRDDEVAAIHDSFG
jgi:glycerol-3-phosphate dehydrogenase